jgi:hypothetical protein
MEAAEGPRYWRGQYWRGQVRTALGVTLLLGVALAFLARDLGFLLIACAVVVIPVWLVISSWLALDAQQPGTTWRGFWRERFLAAAPIIIGFVAGIAYYGRGELDWDDLRIAAPVLIGVVVRAPTFGARRRIDPSAYWRRGLREFPSRGPLLTLQATS